MEAIKRIKESLNPQGIYITNIIGSLSGKYSQNIKNVVKTLKQCFKYIYVFKAQEKNEHQKRQNLIVVAVDQEVHFNIVSYHNINQKRYHQGMINHVDDIDYTNGHILRDKNYYNYCFILKNMISLIHGNEVLPRFISKPLFG